MIKKDLCLFIPAVKKNVAFPDDLVKRLDEITLIQRAINTGLELVNRQDLFVVTDSQEITLVCERNNVGFFYNENLKLSDSYIIQDLKKFILGKYKNYKFVQIYYAYFPLLSSDNIRTAYELFIQNDYDVLVSVKKQKHNIYQNSQYKSLTEFGFTRDRNHFYSEQKAFIFFKSELIKENSVGLKVQPYVLEENIIGIESYQDWWLCEKLLKRKRIVFRVIGNEQVGMGHIYRTLTIAHEITDHEIIFVCDEKDRVAIIQVSGNDYLAYSFPGDQIEDELVKLKPDLIINDMLDTSAAYITKLKQADIKVVNFEDLSDGAVTADITFNELYNMPVLSGENIRWGYTYSFLRDEFNDARVRTFNNEVKSVLLTFGGADQQNLTMKILSTIVGFCMEQKISVHVVTGAAYPYKNELMAYIDGLEGADIDFTSVTGVISKIMEKCDLAISSNGRTVYELCHMNIPGLIISHHEREKTHLFANEKNGFIPLGIYESGTTEREVKNKLSELVTNIFYRKQLFDSMEQYNFLTNKSRVINLITDLIE